jgi:hypothetical protein
MAILKKDMASVSVFHFISPGFYESASLCFDRRPCRSCILTTVSAGGYVKLHLEGASLGLFITDIDSDWDRPYDKLR